MKTYTPFASNNLTEHLLRGSFGGVSLFFALKIAPTHPIFALGLGLLTLLAFRGCPMCWTIGFIEIMKQKFKK